MAVNLGTQPRHFLACWLFSGLLVVASVAATMKFGAPSSLNEVGDAIAGFSGCLAFIWLVGGLLAQQNELAKTRQTMEAQAEYQRRQDSFGAARLYLEGLNNTASSFQSLFMVANAASLKLDPTLIGGFQSFWILGKRVRELQDQSTDEASRSLQRYVQPLNREIQRFHQRYCALVEFLNESPDGVVVRDALLEHSIYADVDREIIRLSQAPGLVGEFYRLNPDSQSRGEK